MQVQANDLKCVSNFKINIDEDRSGKAKRQFQNEINSAVNLKLSDLTVYVYRLERF